MNDEWDWLSAITIKRPEVALILHALLIHARAHGEVDASAAHNIPVTHHNVRGAAMKYLGKCGIKKSEPIQATAKQSHGRWMWRWIVHDNAALERALDRLSGAVLRIEKEQSNKGQLSLI